MRRGLIACSVVASVAVSACSTAGDAAGPRPRAEVTSTASAEPSLSTSAMCVGEVLTHLRVNYTDAANNTSVNSDAFTAQWLAAGAADTEEWPIYGSHNSTDAIGVLSGLRTPEEQLAEEAPEVVRQCAAAYGQSVAAAAAGLALAGVTVSGGPAPEPVAESAAVDVAEPVPGAPGPTGSPEVGAGSWSTAARWPMDCRSSSDRDHVDVHHEVTGDVTGDGVPDTVVAASCVATTSAWPDSVVLFDGATDNPVTVIDDRYPNLPVVESLTLDGNVILVSGTLRTPAAPSCCPDQRFTDRYEVTETGVRRLAPAQAAGRGQPVGYGDVKLAMTREELLATGKVTAEPPPGPGCSTYDLSYGGQAVYSPTRREVVAILFAGDMTTSKGIRVGESADQVRRAYPDAAEDLHGYWTVPIAAGVQYRIGAGDGTVSELALESTRQDCSG